MLRKFHIGEGGLLHRLEAAAHLTSLSGQVATALVLTWVPVVLFGLGAELITGRPEPIIRDVSVHVRLLVATPVFLILDRVFPAACGDCLEQLVVQGFVPIGEEPRFERLLQRATRLACALLPELVFVVLGLVLGLFALWGMVPMSGLPRGGAQTASQFWYALVDWPFFQFLLWRSLWRWAIWTVVLFGLSRLDLALVPAHPDRRAGIKFLSEPSVKYCALILFAISSVLCADWGGKLTFATLDSFAPVLVAFGAVAVLIAFGPLFFFAPRLLRARRAGLTESAAAATAFGRRLRHEWLENRHLEPRARADPRPLAYLTQIYSNTAQRLAPVLFDKWDMVLLLIATLVPVVAVMFVHIPSEDWSVLISLITGGRFK